MLSIFLTKGVKSQSPKFNKSFEIFPHNHRWPVEDGYISKPDFISVPNLSDGHIDRRNHRYILLEGVRQDLKMEEGIAPRVGGKHYHRHTQGADHEAAQNLRQDKIWENFNSYCLILFLRGIPDDMTTGNKGLLFNHGKLSPWQWASTFLACWALQWSREQKAVTQVSFPPTLHPLLSSPPPTKNPTKVGRAKETDRNCNN